MVLDANGAAGGFGILWDPNLLNIINFVASRNMFSTHFHILGTSVWGIITNVYDPFQMARKATFLEDIRSMKDWLG